MQCSDFGAIQLGPLQVKNTCGLSHPFFSSPSFLLLGQLGDWSAWLHMVHLDYGTQEGKESKKRKQPAPKQAPQIIPQESLDKEFEDPINAAIIQHL